MFDYKYYYVLKYIDMLIFTPLDKAKNLSDAYEMGYDIYYKDVSKCDIDKMQIFIFKSLEVTSMGMLNEYEKIDITHFYFNKINKEFSSIGEL